MNRLSQTLTEKDYLEILNDIPLDQIVIIDSLIEFYHDPTMVRDEVWKKYQAYDQKLMEIRKRILSGQKSEWKKYSENYFENDACFLGGMQELGFSIFNDIISLKGPYTIFGVVGGFEKSLSEFSRGYYHDYFKAILRSFKSDFILYAPEWYGIGDGDNETKNVSDLLAVEDWRKVSSPTIHTMDYVYFEDLRTGQSSR